MYISPFFTQAPLLQAAEKGSGAGPSKADLHKSCGSFDRLHCADRQGRLPSGHGLPPQGAESAGQREPGRQSASGASEDCGDVGGGGHREVSGGGCTAGALWGGALPCGRRPPDQEGPRGRARVRADIQ